MKTLYTLSNNTPTNFSLKKLSRTLSVLILFIFFGGRVFGATDCPSGVALTPSAAQVKCVGAAGTQLTATTSLGTSGTTANSVTYTWYYNTTSTTTISGSTVTVQTTSNTNTNSVLTDTYTPPTTISDVGDKYYFCVITYNLCSGNSTRISNIVQVTVNQATVSVSSGTASPTVCSGTAITDIVFAVGGTATSATASGLPTGVTFNAGTLTLSGSPTTTSTYTITTTGGTCTAATTTGTITANPLATISLSSGTASQAVCSGTPITNNVYTIGGSATGSSASGLPTGVTYNSGTLTLSGSPTTTSTYTITTTGGSCPATATGTITSNPLATISLSSGTSSPMVCSGTAITNIVYTIGGSATGSSASGLPTGVSYNSGTNTLSGSPTTTSTYTITTTGGSCPTTATGTITANPLATISLSSGPANQTVCSGTAITNDVFTIGGSATGSSASGLPTGVTYNSGTLTLSGSPTSTSTYTVTTTGGSCPATATGTITANVATVSLSSGTASQAVCNGSAITNIVFSVGGTASGANATGLPTGVTFNTGTLTLSGNPTTTSTYTITTTGGSCTAATTTGTITANPLATISLSSGTASQAVCSGTPITNIVYSIGGSATGTSASGLPTGVTYNTATRTLSGSPTTTSTYSITTTGGSCPATATGTITANPLGTISLSSGTASQTVCSGTAITNIVYSIGGSSTGTSASGLPTGVVYDTVTRTLSGNPTSTSTYTITTTGTSCPTTATGTITANPLATITLSSGTASQTVCSGTAITSIVYSIGGSATGTSASGLPTGVTYNTATRTLSGNPTTTATYTITTTGGSCPATATGTITANPLATISLSSGSANQTVCSGNAITNIVYSIGGSATGTSASGLPTGVTYNTATRTLSGNPTTTSTYTITTTGGSCPATATGTITANPLATISLSSGSASQTVCSATPITNNTYTIGGSATGSSASGLPTGVAYNSGTLTLSGNPTTTTTYTITTTGGSCPATTTGTITVNPIPVATATNSNQTICSGASFTTMVLGTSNSVVGTTFAWSRDNTVAVTGGAASGNTSTIPGVALTNTTSSPVTVTFTITPTGPAATLCTGAPITATVIVNPTPSVTLVSSVTPICGGDSTTITFNTLPNNVGGTGFNWTRDNTTNVTGTNSQSGISSFPPLTIPLSNATNVNQTTNVTITPVFAGCFGTSVATAISVKTKPVLFAYTQTICSGNAFSITPSNGSPTAATIVPVGTTYTWTAPTISGSAGNITGGSAQNTGQSSISQTLVNTTNSAKTATYTVTPSFGGCTGATFTITVTVSPTPSIATSQATICSGTAFSISPTNGGTNIVPAGTTYTWTSPVVSGGITGGSASSGSSISQTLTNPTNVADSAFYTITPTSGVCTGSTFIADITVNPTPVLFAYSQTICSGNAFTLTPVNNSPTNATIVPGFTTYAWANPTVTGGITGGSASSGSTISQTLVNPTNSLKTAAYTVIPTSGAAGSCVGSAFQVNVTVNPTPSITTSQTATICSGGTFTVTPTTGSGNIVPVGTTYTWTNPGISGSISGGSASSGSSISQTLTNSSNVAQTATYTVTPNSGGCPGATFIVTVTVNPTPSITTSQAATICSGNLFTVTPTTGGGNIVPASINYTWTNPGISGSISGGSASSGSIISQTLTNTSNITQTATYTVTPNAGTCAGATFNVSVTVNPKPVLFAYTPSICSGTAFTVSPVNGVPSGTTIIPTGTTYNWSNPTVSGGITGASSSSGSTISQTLFNPTNIPQSAIYTITPTSGAAGACVGSAFTTTVSVNPTPALFAYNTSICSGQSFTVAPIDGSPSASTIVPVSTTYTWATPSISGSPSNISGGSAQAVGQPNISQTLTNNTSTNQTATYTVLPTSGAAGSCVGSTFTVNVNLNTKPVIANKTTTICSNTAFLVNPADGVGGDIVPAGTTYTWTVTANGGITGASAQVTGLSSISQTLTNPTNINQTATYTVIPTFGGCSGNSFTIIVTVNPTPVISNQTATICSGTAFSITPANGGSNIVPNATTYSWAIPTGSNISGGSALAGQSSIGQTLTNTSNVTTTASYVVTPTSGASGSCIGSAFTVIVTINATPQIPVQSTTICSGTPFSFAPVNNNGSTVVPLNTSYAWVAPTGATFTGGSASSGTSISQTLTNTANVNTTATYVIIPTSGATGSCIGAPFNGVVTINPTPQIPNQIATICSGAAFSINPINNGSTVVPSPTSYAWGNPIGSNITGGSAQSNQSLISQTLTNTTNVVQSTTYVVVPTSNASGNCTGSAFNILVTVNPTPVLSSYSQTICSGSAFTISPVNNFPTSTTLVPSGTTYSWAAAVVTGGIIGGNAVLSQSNISQILINPTNITQTALYTVIPTSGVAGGCVGAPFTVLDTVNPTPVMSSYSQSICSGTAFTISPVDGMPNASTIVPSGTTYSWSNPLVSGSITGGSAQSVQSQISEILTNPTNVFQTAIYTVVPRSGAAGGCVGAAFIIRDTVNPTPVIFDYSATICSGTAFNITPNNGVPAVSTIVPLGTTYDFGISSITGGITGAFSNTGQSTISQTLTNPTNVTQFATYTVTPTSGVAGSCVGATFLVNDTINPTPVLSAYSQTICSGTAFSVSPQDGVPTASTIIPNGTTYTWSNPPTVTGNITGGSAQSGQSLISQTLSNPTNVFQTATYIVTPRSGAAGGCIGSSFVITDTVNPAPVLQAYTQAICSQLPFTVSPQNGVPTVATIIPAGTTYSWSNPGGGVGGISGTSADTLQSNISDILSNPTNVTQTVTYTVLARSGAAGNCLSLATFPVTINVNPTPVIHDTAVTVCSGSSFSITPTNGISNDIVPAGTTYSWFSAPTVTGGITGGSAQTTQSNISQTLINPTNSQQTATYTVTPVPPSAAAGICTGSTFIITVHVNPTPNLETYNQTICSGTSFQITPINNQPTSTTIVPAGTTYSWPTPTVTGLLGGGSALANQSTISQLLTDPFHNDSILHAQYIVTPNSGVCIGRSDTVNITINPSAGRPNVSSLPLDSLHITQKPYHLPLCGGSTNVSFNIDSSLSNIIYKWYASDTIAHILKDSTSNTVVSFGIPSSVDTTITISVTGIDTLRGGCRSDTAYCHVTLSANHFTNATITTLAPNLLWYQDNALDPNGPVDGYQWGVDTIANGRPANIVGQTYQVFVPNPIYCNGSIQNNPLNTNLFWFWVQIRKGDCVSKIYYNGPYHRSGIIQQEPTSDIITTDVLPNPNSGNFDLEIKGNLYGNISMKIVNLLGQKVFEENIEKLDGTERYSLELPNIEKGVYFIDVLGSYNEHILSKLIITK